MGKALVIVESPAKAKTINKYLGSDYVVKSSVGHIRDLPTSGSAAKRVPTLPPPRRLKSLKRMNVALSSTVWGLTRGTIGRRTMKCCLVKKVVSELKQLAEKADHIYLATDLDREGKPLHGTCGK